MKTNLLLIALFGGFLASASLMAQDQPGTNPVPNPDVVSPGTNTVPPDADAEAMEKLRAHLETILNEATRRAYARVGRAEAGHG